MELSVIIPVHESVRCLPLVVNPLMDVLKHQFSSFEIICVDDGSLDDSWRGIQELHKRFPQVKGVRLSKNFGQWPATLCGLEIAVGAILLVLDDDGQCNLDDALKLISLVESRNHDIAFGIRRSIRNRILDRTFRLMLPKRHNSSFFAVRKEVIQPLGAQSSIRTSVDTHVMWTIARDRIGHCEVVAQPRFHGETSYPRFGRIKLLLQNIPNYLTWFHYALFIASLGVILAIWDLALTPVYFFVLFISFAYLLEIFRELKGKPPYWIIEKWPNP